LNDGNSHVNKMNGYDLVLSSVWSIYHHNLIQYYSGHTYFTWLRVSQVKSHSQGYSCHLVASSCVYRNRGSWNNNPTLDWPNNLCLVSCQDKYQYDVYVIHTSMLLKSSNKFNYAWSNTGVCLYRNYI